MKLKVTRTLPEQEIVVEHSVAKMTTLTNPYLLDDQTPKPRTSATLQKIYEFERSTYPMHKCS